MTAPAKASVEPADGAREALAPFATFGLDESGNDIRDGLMRDRICDWFGPSDFDAARAAYNGCGVQNGDAWQPLETAPLDPLRDPPLVMLWVDDGGHQGSGTHAFGRCYRSHDGKVRGVASGFSGNWSIRYWRPLPAGPSLSSAEPLPDWKQDQAETSRIMPKGRDHFIAEAIADIASELSSTDGK